jgi:hypothetical protein
MVKFLKYIERDCVMKGGSWLKDPSGVLDAITQLNNATKGIWPDNFLHNKHIVEYSYCFSFETEEDFIAICSNVINLLDVLMIGLHWEELQQREAPDLSGAVAASRFAIKHDMFGDVFEAAELEIHQKTQEHYATFNPALFGKGGEKTKTGWLIRAINQYVPNDYPRRYAFISHLLNELSEIDTYPSFVRSTILKGLT